MGMALGLNGAGLFQRIQFSPLIIGIISNKFTVRMSFPVQGGGTSYDNGNSISSLSDGSSIVTGYFGGTATFGSTTLTSDGDDDFFFAKLSALPYCGSGRSG